MIFRLIAGDSIVKVDVATTYSMQINKKASTKLQVYNNKRIICIYIWKYIG